MLVTVTPRLSALIKFAATPVYAAMQQRGAQGLVSQDEVNAQAQRSPAARKAWMDSQTSPAGRNAFVQQYAQQLKTPAAPAAPAKPAAPAAPAKPVAPKAPGNIPGQDMAAMKMKATGNVAGAQALAAKSPSRSATMMGGYGYDWSKHNKPAVAAAPASSTGVTSTATPSSATGGTATPTPTPAPGASAAPAPAPAAAVTPTPAPAAAPAAATSAAPAPGTPATPAAAPLSTVTNPYERATAKGVAGVRAAVRGIGSREYLNLLWNPLALPKLYGRVKQNYQDNIAGIGKAEQAGIPANPDASPILEGLRLGNRGSNIAGMAPGGLFHSDTAQGKYIKAEKQRFDTARNFATSTEANRDLAQSGKVVPMAGYNPYPVGPSGMPPPGAYYDNLDQTFEQSVRPSTAQHPQPPGSGMTGTFSESNAGQGATASGPDAIQAAPAAAPHGAMPAMQPVAGTPAEPMKRFGNRI